MSTERAPTGDLIATVKSQEVQRAMLAEMAGDSAGASRHFLAAAHLELVLADDYASLGSHDLSLRSSLSAASCLWRGGQIAEAQALLKHLLQVRADQARQIQQVLAELSQDYPARAG